MPQPRFHRAVQPLSPSAISYLRTRFQCGLSLAVPGRTIPPMQALLLFSLTYGAGARASELPNIRIRDLIDPDGRPADFVRFDRWVTKHAVPRRVPMHADVRRDLIAFREAFPDEAWIAFVHGARTGGSRRMPASAVTSWFRACVRQAGLGQFTLSSGRKSFLERERQAA